MLDANSRLFRRLSDISDHLMTTIGLGTGGFIPRYGIPRVPAPGQPGLIGAEYGPYRLFHRDAHQTGTYNGNEHASSLSNKI